MAVHDDPAARVIVDRYVLPVGQGALLDQDGFLLVETGRQHPGYPDRAHPVGRLAQTRSSYVLLAAGGVGKTRTLRLLAECESGARYFDLAEDDYAQQRTQIEAAVAQGAPVYLDSLDYAAGSGKAPFRALARYLQSPAARAVPWRLACRQAAWPPGFAAQVKRALSGFEELTLLPLTRAAAETAVTAAGHDGAGFLRALVAARLGRLAASPQRLIAAAAHWSARGQLPGSHVEAVAFEIEQFLTEFDEDRPEQLPRDQALRVAGRLAAFTMFCDIRRFANANADGHGLSAAALPSAVEPDLPGVSIGPGEYRQVLGTALFQAAPGGAQSFRHQQYAEYLAAHYLVRRGVAREQLPALLGVHANGLLPGSRVGVAAWLAALGPGLLPERLLERNALAFVQAAVELPSTRVRALVVDGLLSQAARGELPPVIGVDLSSLAAIQPDDLQDLLAERLRSGASEEELWWIVRLAVAGACRSLAVPLAAVARDADRPGWLRAEAVRALRTLDAAARYPALRRLLPVDPADDPEHHLLAALLHTLYPQALTAGEMLAALRTRPWRDLIAWRWPTLQQVFSRVPDDDLPALLDWFADHRVDAAESIEYDRTYMQLVWRAWSHSDSEEIRQALARLLVTGQHTYRWLLYQNRADPVPWYESEASRRREMALLVARSADTSAWHAVLDLRLLIPADAGWLIGELPGIPEPARTALGHCLQFLLASPDAETLDAVRAMDRSHPAYAATAYLREAPANTPPPVPAARDESAAHPYPRPEALASVLIAALHEACADWTAWWRVEQVLSCDTADGTSRSAQHTHDLTQRPGWALLTAEQQDALVEAGLTYLRRHTPCPASANAPAYDPDQAARDWSGVYLLTTLLRHQPQHLDTLDHDAWTRWALPIMTAPDADTGEESELRLRLVRAAPAPARAAMVTVALRRFEQLRVDEIPQQPWALYRELAQQLFPLLGQRLTADAYERRIAIGILYVLAQVFPEHTLPLCRALAADTGSSLHADVQLLLDRLDPNRVLDTLSAEDPAQLADRLDDLRIADLDDAHLCSAARLCLDAFPPADDPERRPGRVVSSTAHHGAMVRDGVLRHLADRGRASDLERLLARRPERAGYVHLIRTARIREADTALTYPAPASLTDLLARGDARLIRNSADLLTVVLDRLRALQHELTHNGAHREVWDGDVPAPEDDISDWVRRHLQPLLTRAAVVDREIQVARLKDKGGLGTRIDLTATAATRTEPITLARVSIEAKRVDHKDLMTSLKTQLDERYLIPGSLTHGIYLVYWIAPDQRPKPKDNGRDSIPALLAELTRQAHQLTSGSHIEPFVLDISRPHPATATTPHPPSSSGPGR